MAEVSQEQVLDQLRTVMDPELNRDIVTLEMVKKVTFDGRTVRVDVELTTPACPLKDKIRGDIERTLTAIDGIEKVEVDFGAQVKASTVVSDKLPNVKNVIAVGAGKGGVGKSTVAVMLAHGLQRAGASVGIMDADVYGPSIPTMAGVAGKTPTATNDKIVPVLADGVKIMSIGFMVDNDRPLIWRGPMAHSVVTQFLQQVDWGELDYLIVDLPPGTGDVPLTLAQEIPMTGAVVVCTPQDIALIDARRAVRMFEQLNVSCLGIIENMSYYLCPKCGHRDELFAHGGAKKAADELGVPFLGEIPLSGKVRCHGDSGEPGKLFTDTDDYVSEAINRVIGNTAGQISIKASSQEAVPTLSVE